MNWLEKVRFLKEIEYDTKYSDFLVDINTHKSEWEEGELEDIIKDYPYLPKSYIEFVKEFDNLGLSFAVFYGSKKGNIIALEEEVEYFKEYLKGEYFPFAKDADGSIFTFNKKGEVIYFSIDDYECEEPEKIADSLEEFVVDCLTGKRYHEFNFIENDTYYNLLQHLGWV